MTLMGQRFATGSGRTRRGDPEPPVEVVKEDPRRSPSKGPCSPRSSCSTYGGRTGRSAQGGRTTALVDLSKVPGGGEVR